MKFLAERKRRNVIRMSGLYLVNLSEIASLRSR
jgi:hypothetical protein